MNRDRIASPAPLGCFAFALTTALLQVCTSTTCCCSCGLWHNADKEQPSWLQGAITGLTDANADYYVYANGMVRLLLLAGLRLVIVTTR
jgi:hypothetical protein